ncbi:hypothetical protein BON30_15425 [Cystobacter ferrugineus]|uniref:Glycosyltransferase n=1 Tax=Cystobacter ferrugineus TaxID=83449 RepID=A0A1L9BDS1_9BACT|nr:hypothetical protein BON30_15425 [Cystobacter ferrugineus]
MAFLGRPLFESHVPLSAKWAQTRFFAVESERWGDTIDAARQWGADASIVFRPQDVTPDLAALVPGTMRVGVIPTPVFAQAELARLALISGPGVEGFRWLTYLDSPLPAEMARLPVLQTMPLPVDTARFVAGPRLEQRRLLVADWARPAPGLMARLRQLAPLEVLPSDASLAQISAALDSAGVLIYSSKDLLGRFDALPLRALARGLLLISDSTFLSDWYIEQEDEYLTRHGDLMVQAVDEWVRMPELFKAVRIRAWQKMREAFDASACFQRMLHDAHLLANPLKHLATLPRGEDAAAAPVLAGMRVSEGTPSIDSRLVPPPGSFSSESQGRWSR